MWTKPYGRTGKQISAVGFGGMRFANQDDIEGNAEIVRYGHSHGINYFDTAPGYGKSEDIFGAAFKHMDRESFYVSTKSGKAKGDDLRADLERSLQRMGLEKIDVFHIWYVLSPEVWKQRLEGGAVATALKAKDEGLIDHLAVSSHMPGEDLAQVLREGPFEGVTLGYCAINFPYRDRSHRPGRGGGGELHAVRRIARRGAAGAHHRRHGPPVYGLSLLSALPVRRAHPGPDGNLQSPHAGVRRHRDGPPDEVALERDA